MLVKVSALGKNRKEIKATTDIFCARIVDTTDTSYIIELTGTCSKLDAFLDAMGHSTILETVRTGASGIGRGGRTLEVK
jgi:acetolactate synthase-1/3 small subunit